MFIWSKLGQNPSQIDVRTFARVKNLIWGWNSPELSCIFVAVQNRRWFCNLKFLFLFTFPEYLTRVLPPVLAMECPTVIKKIVFTSPEAMVEFSGEKNKVSALVKNPFNLCKFIFIWKVKGKTSSLSPIANHAKTLCKECETKSLTIQALGQLWITQSLMFTHQTLLLNIM